MAEDDIVEEEDSSSKLRRNEDMLGARNSKLRRKVAELADQIRKGFEDQIDRADNQMDWWECYNCILGRNQRYSGNSDVFVPIVRVAVDAIVTRFSAQLFPKSERYVEAVSENGREPFEMIALIGHYIRAAKLKNQIVKALLRHGVIEGQFNLYVDWEEAKRWIVSRETHQPIDEETGVELAGEEPIDDVTEPEERDMSGPAFEVLHDSDVLLSPSTANSVEQALVRGGHVVIARRWSKSQVEDMIARGEIRKNEGRDLADMMNKAAGGADSLPKPAEASLVEDVGIRAKGSGVSVWEVWKMLPMNGKGAYSEDSEDRRLCKIWIGPGSVALGCRRNPNWNDRCNLLSVPISKVGGVGKGQSMVEPVAPMQWAANNAANQGEDSAELAALPIVTRDTSRYNGPLVMNVGAIWPVSPNDIKILEFPDLTPRAVARIQYYMQAIFQALSVNPAMMPQSTGRPGAKRNQAEIAMEQQIDLMGADEGTSNIEEGILSEVAAWIVDLDHQYREKMLLVRSFGELGVGASMIEVDPQRNRKGLFFRWIGASESQQNIAMMQQGTAYLNVLKGARQELAAEGYELHIGPAFERGAINIFGPATGLQILRDMKHQLSMDPNIENQLMIDGHEVGTHPMDNAMEHIQSHMQAARATGDPAQIIRAHIQAHIAQAKVQSQMMMMAQAQQVAPGQGPQGAPTGPPGGGPRPGAMPSGPRAVQGPPGMARPDNMPGSGALTMPRRA